LKTEKFIKQEADGDVGYHHLDVSVINCPVWTLRSNYNSP